MRAQLSLFAVVVTLVAVLAVMPKGRAAGDVADEAGEISSATPAKPASENTNEILRAQSPDTETKVTPEDTEALIGAVYQSDDSKLWGNGVNWTQLKVTSQNADGVDKSEAAQIDHSFRPMFLCVSDLSAHPFGSSERDRMLAGKAYLAAARKLDEIANDLEEAKLFRDADQVREMTGKLRTRARAFPSEPASDSPESAVQNFSFFVGGSR